MFDYKNKLNFTYRTAVFTLLFAVPSLTFAEYYIVYPAPSTCQTCVVRQVKHVTYKKVVHKKPVVHKKRSSCGSTYVAPTTERSCDYSPPKRRSHFSMTVTYPATCTVCCQTRCGVVRERYSNYEEDGFDVFQPVVVHHVRRDYYSNEDLRTGDDDADRYPDMDIDE